MGPRTGTRRLTAVAMASVAMLAFASSAQAEPRLAQSVADFRDSIGVNTHISFYDTVYGDWARLVDKMDELGIDHLRDGAFANPAPEWR